MVFCYSPKGLRHMASSELASTVTVDGKQAVKGHTGVYG